MNAPTRVPDPPPALDGFTYEDVLGVGGFSTVYLYRQSRPRRRVAVKVLRADGLSGDGRGRFEAEADIMAALSTHPNIVTILDADVTADGRPYLVMEYYPGRHMGERARLERMSVEEVLEIGVQVASALESAHRAGIVHRDVKPANVLTSEYNRPGLTDFGISVLANHPTLDPGAGSDEGMSIPWSPPEAFRADGELDSRSDIYSLGALVYTMLAGRSPFEGPGSTVDRTVLIERIVAGGAYPIGREDVPVELEQLLEQALATDPRGRPATALDVAHALQQVQGTLGQHPTRIDVLDVAGPMAGATAAPLEPAIAITAPRPGRAGAPVVASPTPEACAGCGTELAVGTRFCRTCGRPATVVPPTAMRPTGRTRPAPRVLGAIAVLVALLAGVTLAAVALRGAADASGDDVVVAGAVGSAPAGDPTPTPSTTPSPTPTPSPTATPSPTPTVPGAPTAVTASYRKGEGLSSARPLGSGYGLTVNWQPPSMPSGMEATGYTITVTPRTGREMTAVSGAADSYTWRASDGQLTPSTVYAVTVTATNEAGRSDASTAARVRTPRGWVAPRAPSPTPTAGGSSTSQGVAAGDGGTSEQPRPKPKPTPKPTQRPTVPRDDILPDSLNPDLVD